MLFIRAFIEVYTNRIFLIGLPGVGKTYAAKLLANELNVPFYDLDSLIEQQKGKAIAVIFEEVGEDGFRKIEADILFSYFNSNQSFVMACGGGTPCFYNNMEYMNQSGLTVYLIDYLDTIAQRLVKEKAQRPLIAKLTNENILPYLQELRAKREPYYLQAHIIVDGETQLAEKLKLFIAG